MALSDILQKVGNNETLTDEERQELRDESRALDEVISVVKRIIQPGSSAILLSGVRITNGKITASDFIALAPSVVTENPTEAGFTGTFISGKGETFGGTVYNIGGVLAGVLQWGANQSTGKLIAGGGDVTIDQFGVTFANQEGFIQFLDTLGNGTLFIYSDGDNFLVLENSFGGKGISFLVDTATHNVLQFNFTESLVAEVAELQISGVNGAVITLGSGVEIWTSKDGQETVFNNDSFDVDERHEGAADANLWKLDAGTDRVGVGVASPGYKLDVNGDVNVASGSNFKINGTNIAGSTTEEIQDIAGAMFTGNTESGVTVTYQDSDGTIDVELTASTNAGWVEVTDTWSYNAPTKITVPSDGTTVYQIGMKIRWKQGGAYKYGIVAALTSTLLTLIDTTDYSVANASITDAAYSYAANPYGFPFEFNFTPSIANLTTTTGTFSAKYNVQGRRMAGHLSFAFGASSAITGALTITFPVTPATYDKTTPIGFCRFKDATGGNAAVGVVFSNGAITVSNASGTYLISDVLSSTVPFTWATSDDFEVDFDFFF